MKRLVLALLPLLCFLSVNAQSIYYDFYDSIPVYHNTNELSNAWAGGFTSPQFSTIDLNGDGVEDLFVFDRNGDIMKTFINEGTPNQSSYRFAPEYLQNFPAGMRFFTLLRDYNGDGRQDIFTYATGGMHVFRQLPHPDKGFQFVEMNTLLESFYDPFWTNLYVAASDMPAIADIDLDGDLDVLSWGVSGNRVEYHQNQSMELYGNANELEYHAVTQCWGNFYEDALDNTVTLGSPCASGSGPDHTPIVAAHSGGTLLARDLNGDLTKELIIGDVSYPTLLMVTNGGDLTTAQGTAQDTLFPDYDLAASMEIFPAAYSLDCNNDGKDDLLVSPNAFSGSEDHENVLYYRNDGTQAVPIYNRIKKRWLSDEMIEVGTNAHPAFVDVTGDGLTDMLVGNHFYFDASGAKIGQLALYENTGSADDPEFSLVTDDFTNFSGLGLAGMLPTFGDMDNDGDLDMLTGDFNGNVHYFENAAGAGNPMNLSLTTQNYMGIDAGQYNSPNLIDIDRDGDLDLVCGERSGTLLYYENTGSPSNAHFDAVPTDDLFGGVDITAQCCTGYSSPYIFEPTPGQYDLLLGDESGNLRQYSNIELYLDQDIDFAVNRMLKTYSHRISPVAVDLNNDGIHEFAYGQHSGGVGMFKQFQLPDTWTVNFGEGVGPSRLPSPDSVVSVAPELVAPEITLAPNPAQANLSVTVTGTTGPVQVRFTDVMGRQVKSMLLPHAGSGAYNLDISTLSQGWYFVTVETNNYKVVERLVKQ